MQPWSQPLLWQGVSTAVACDNYFNNTVLLMSFDDVNGSITAPGFQDFSPSAHGNATLIGGAGSVAISTAQAQFGPSSMNVTGLNGISYANSTDWVLAPTTSSQYTAEFWVRWSVTPVAAPYIALWFPSAGFVGNSWEIMGGSTASEVRFRVTPDGSTSGIDITTSGAGIANGIWYAIAVDYDGTKCRIYINGVMRGSVTPANGATNAGTRVLAIGQDSQGGGAAFKGWIDELRITKGVARYASDAGYTVPTAAFPRVQCPDPSFSNVVLLMGFEGANGSTGAPGFNDESPAANGTAGWISTPVIDTSQFKFGTSSLHGVGGGLIYPAGPNWNLSSANSDQFTIEFWVRFNTISTSNILVAQYTVSGTFSWTVQTASATDINFGFSPDGTFASQVVVGTTGASLTTGTWYFIAVDKDATGKIRVYVNGVMRGSATPASSAFFHSSVSLGIEITAGGGGPLDGWMDELRITKGVARYANDAGFTPPTARFPRS
jgi:hypothetical protein